MNFVQALNGGSRGRLSGLCGGSRGRLSGLCGGGVLLGAEMVDVYYVKCSGYKSCPKSKVVARWH